MKHCAKKLLGLAFALALCLAVGGTALAQTPESADVPAALPEQEMLAYEPNVTTAAEGMNTITGDGYTVTIPTTVEVKSGENEGKLEVKGELEVTAVMKQWRTLSIVIEPQTPTSGAWTLKYNGSASAGTTLPQVEYNLPYIDGEYDENGKDFKWLYQNTYKQLSFNSPKLGGPDDVSRTKMITAKLAVTVPYPEQATMSGTYSDILTFRITPGKTCITYNINVYEQKLQLTADGKSVEAVDMVNADGTVKYGAEPVYTEILEYPIKKDENKPWSYSGKEEDAALRWEKATATMNTYQDASDMTDNKVDTNNNVTINLNLKRKCYYLDVNGATDYTDADVVGGNQGEHIGSFVEIMLSGDGKNWTDWFWHEPYGDDYWAKLPYGVHFKLGLHHVKNGYVYDTGTGTLERSGVRIIANKEEKYTATGEPVNGSTYYVYTGEMTGEPTGTDGVGNLRYCYIPCYKKGLTYIANDGTGGTESVNTGNPPRSNVLYEDDGRLKTPEALRIDAPAGKSFAGWSTKSTYTTGDRLYQPGEPVSNVKWDDTYTGEHLSKRPKLNGKIDDQKRELYAIWGYDIKVEFEDTTGYTPAAGTPVLGKPMTKTYTLTGQAVEKGKDWVMDLDDPQVIDMLADATDAAKAAVGDTRTEVDSKYVWKIDKYTDANGGFFDYTPDRTIKAEDLEKPNPTLMIKRRRYLLSVISVDVDTDRVNGIATKAGKLEFGTFNVTIDGISDLGVTGKSHCQVGLNYGAKYTVDTMQEIAPYYAIHAVIPESLTVNNKINLSLVKLGASYTSHMTGKQTGIHYYLSSGVLDDDGYIGDPVRVVFSDTGNTTGSTTPMPGPSLAPAKKALTLRYHANFDPAEELALDLDPDPLLDDMDDTFGFDPDPLLEDVDDALEEAVKTVSYRPGEDVVLRNCMFKRGGYVFAGWNTEPDGTGKGYEVNGVPITDWAAGNTVDLYAQWKKPEHLKPVWDDPDPTDPGDPADPDTPPEDADTAFGVDPAQPEELDDAFGVDPAQPEGLDDAFGVDPAPPEEPDAAFGVDPDPPEELDDAFGVDPDPLPEELDDAFGVDPAPPEELDDAFGVDPDPLPEELDDAFSV